MKRTRIKSTKATAAEIRNALGITRENERAARKANRAAELKRGKSKLGPNRKRKAKAFAENFGGKDRVLWGKARRCDTCGALPPSQNSHVLTRGSGLGKAREMISQCDKCHRYTERGEYSIEYLQIVARGVYAEWLAQGGHELSSGLETHGETR